MQRVLDERQDRERPSYDEIIEARTRTGFEMDARLGSQRQAAEQLSELLTQLKRERADLEVSEAKFRDELAAIKAEALDEGMKRVTETVAALEPEPAKDQLMKMFDDDRMDQVVRILESLGGEQKRDILATFQSVREQEMLAELLQMLGRGAPVSTLAENAG